jgi:hypothetical protein
MNKKRKSNLGFDSISTLVDWAAEEIEKAGVESGERLRFRLSLEEVLLYARDQCHRDNQ